MEELQEKSLLRETKKIEISAEQTPFDSLDPEVQLAIRCAQDKKGMDIRGLDLREIATFTEYFILVTGSNQRQVQAIADDINEKVKSEFSVKPVRIEGYAAAEWVLLDYGDFIVHIFDKDARDFYDLERLWLDAGRVEIPE